jgi:CRP-like cAMP-binding protein
MLSIALRVRVIERPTLSVSGVFFQNPNKNKLLAALPEADFQRISGQLELRQMVVGEVLYAAGETLTHLYFPTSCVISLHYEMANGTSSEFSAVGNEGAVGLSLFLADATMSSAAVVQTAGEAYRLSLTVLREEFSRAGATLQLLLRYTQAHLSQVSQQAICQSHHLIDQKLCTWLLQRLDRCPDTEIIITQDLVAHALGVRREGINESTQKLLQLGYISCRRGHITVLNRAGVERLSCECYGVSKKEFTRLLPDSLLTTQIYPAVATANA